MVYGYPAWFREYSDDQAIAGADCSRESCHALFAQLRCMASINRSAGEFNPVLKYDMRPHGVGPKSNPEIQTMPATIIYTETDEAPALATYSFLPIVQAYARAAGVTVESRDISLSGRIIANFPDRLTAQQTDR